MIRLLRYLFWNLWYTVFPPRRDFIAYMVSVKRRWWPWRKFQPYVFRNAEGRSWECTWSDEPDFHACIYMRVDAHVSQETGSIIGLTLFDEDLDDFERHQRAPHPILSGAKLIWSKETGPINQDEEKIE